MAAESFAAAWPRFQEVPASTNEAHHLVFANDIVELRAFPQEGGRLEGCTNLCEFLSSVPTNRPAPWSKVRTKKGELTLWIGLGRTNGVSRTLGLALAGGASQLNVCLILANGTDKVADVSAPIAARLQPFERRLFQGVVDSDAAIALREDPAVPPMNDAAGRACAAAVAQGHASSANGDFEAALRHFDRALGFGDASAPLHVCKAYCLRKLGVKNQQLRAQSSKALRMAAKSEPLDVWNLVERTFLEDDGEGAASAAASFGGDGAYAIGLILERYGRLGAKAEAEELERQSRASAVQ